MSPTHPAQQVAPTPGPWVAVKGSLGGHPDVWEVASNLGDHEYEIVANVATRKFSTLTKLDAARVEANASLIAAAPDLLAALLYYRDNCSGAEPSVSVFHRMCDEAIARATGIPPAVVE